MADRLDIYSFGRQLVETGDLDPVYILVHESSMSSVQQACWLLAYFCFYHVGTASWIADPIRHGPYEDEYWRRMWAAARSKEYPRSAERRHFRGENAIKSMAFLEAQTVEGLFTDFYRAYYERRTLSVSDVMEYVQEWVGFGPWISFKVADMLERLDICKVSFKEADVYTSPRNGALLLWEDSGRPNTSNVVDWAMDRITTELSGVKAPPRYERDVNEQEAETVLCKFHSYRKGRYHVGEDIAACRKGLLRFAKCRTSQDLLKAGRQGGLWS